MALNFEFENEILTNKQPFISYDTNSELFNYSIKNEISQVDSNGVAQLGQYDNVVFSGEGHHITSKDVTRIGGKNVPGIGTIAFYKDARTGACYIVNVVNYKAPTLSTLEYSNSKLHIKITSPIDVHYTCYRLVMTQGDFAFECIVYGNEDYIETPLVKGDYEAYCFGYDEINGIISPLSNTVSINIPVGLDNWKPISVNEQTALLNRIKGIEDDVDDIQEDIEDIQENIEGIHTEVDGATELVDNLNGEVI